MTNYRRSADDPTPDVAATGERPDLAALGAEIVALVSAALPTYLRSRVSEAVESTSAEVDTTSADVEAAIAAATERVAAELQELFALPLREQRRTPLELVRSAAREPTAVLAELGVARSVRDPFHIRAWPDDTFGLVPDGVVDLGDPDLGPCLLAWGVVKAARLRTEATLGD